MAGIFLFQNLNRDISHAEPNEAAPERIAVLAFFKFSSGNYTRLMPVYPFCFFVDVRAKNTNRTAAAASL